MKILVINSGSSSLKFKLFKMLDESVICKGLIEKIGADESFIHFSHQQHVINKCMHIKDHHDALEILFDLIFEEGLLMDIDELYAVGHRVVHGGVHFSKATKINGEVIHLIKELIPLAPLHNPANIEGILAIEARCSELKQVAVFDTAFHHKMPEYASRYALENTLYSEDTIRRYGFHGTSHAFILKRACILLEKASEQTSIISLHLGNGASACAIEQGQSVDTSMGFTPLEGLVMGSRSGDIDPAIVFYLHRHKGYTIDEIDTLLNTKSGLFGLCGEKDMRTILQKAELGNKYQLAIDIFVYRIKKQIGAYLAILPKLDAIVFTAGIGEHSSEIRALVCEGLQGLGIVYDKVKNKESNQKSFSFEGPSSLIKLFVIATDEELEIALQTKEVLESE